MKTTVSQYEFIDAFTRIRPNQFSYEGLCLLFDYLESYEADTGEEIELDVIGLCCSYAESTIEELLNDYDLIDEDERADFAKLSGDEQLQVLQDKLAYETSVIGTTDELTIVYQQY